MTHRIGPKQRAILRAVADGQELWKLDRRWKLDEKTVNRERCMTLFMRGYIMMTSEWINGYRFVLTDKGRAAL
jgi:hypothetical protein